MKVYLSGPMTGVELHNHPAFNEAAANLRERGFEVVSPAEMSVKLAQDLELIDPILPYEGNEDLYEQAFSAILREQFLAQDVAAVTTVDAVVVLPGWERSEGAILETDLARALNKSVLRYPGLDTVFVEAGDLRADPSGAVKADVGKPRMDLLPRPALLGTAEVLGFGAKKYADHNWRKGFAWSRIYGAALRHLTAWFDGEDLDPESGLHHLDHAACCVMFLQTYVKTSTGTDDRYKEER